MLTTLIPPTSGTAEVAGLRRDARPARRCGGGSATSARATAPGTASAVGTSWSARVAATACAVAEARARAAELIDSLDLGECRRPQGVDALRRPAAPAGHRDGPDPRAGAALPRRAVHRPRPAEPGQPAGAHPARCGREHGTTIVLTTHYLDEADSMAERVIVVDHGRIIADDTPDRLKAELAGDRITPRRSPTSGRRPGRRRAGGRAVGRARPTDRSSARCAPCHVRVADGPGRLPGIAAPTWPRPASPSRRRGHPAHARRRLPQPDRPQPARGRTHRDHEGRSTASEHVETWHDHMVTDTVTVFSRELRPVLRNPFSRHLQHDPAAGVPRPVRAAAARTRRDGGSRAAVVRARHRGHVVPVRHVDDRRQPALRDPDRLARADAGRRRCAARRCSSAGR